MSEFISTREAGTLLGVSRHTVVRMFREGKIAGIQPRSKILIDRQSVQLYLDRVRRRRERQELVRRAIQPFKRRK